MEDFPLSKRIELHELWLKTNGVERLRLDLSETSMRGIDAHKAVLTGAKLNDADLRHAEMNGTDLIGSDLRGADLRGHATGGSGFSRRQPKLRAANLCGADLRGAILAGTDFSYASLLGASLEGAKVDQDTNFSNSVVNLDDLRDLDLARLKRENLPPRSWQSEFAVSPRNVGFGQWPGYCEKQQGCPGRTDELSKRIP